MRSRQELLQYFLESGQREHARGNFDSAGDAYRQALAVAPGHPGALSLLGTALLQRGQPQEAVGYLEHAARTLREHADVIGALAQAYSALGRHEEARSAFRKASRLDPRNFQFPLGAAISLAMQGHLRDAETALRKLGARCPNEALIWFNLGNVMRDQKRFAEAIDSYRQALVRDARLVDARNNLAGILHALERFDEAEREFRACIDLAPDYLAARLNLASVMIDLGRCGEAEALCRDVIERAPGAVEASAMLGAALGHQGRMLEALACHRKVVEISPRNQHAIETYAAALADAGYFSEAWQWFARALSADPNSVRAHQLLSSALLAVGRFAEGWAEYTYRAPLECLRETFPDIPLSRTLPADLSGKRVAVLREQGLGDEIFFLRYAPQLSARGARVTYRANNKLRSVLARVPCLAQVLDESAALPPADAVILVGDLPHALGARSADGIPGTGGVNIEIPNPDLLPRHAETQSPVPPSIELKPLDDRIEDVRKRLAAAGAPPYLGITWRAGTPPREQGVESWKLYKEIAVPLLGEALMEFPGTVLGLQRMPAPGNLDRLAGALGRPVHDFTDLNEDLEGMLALLALIDEYVGVSNTNMHLRAGVGRTARVLAPCPADWRWMNAGPASPWFPGFAIYRQSLQGDWSAALAALRRDLAETWLRPTPTG